MGALFGRCTESQEHEKAPQKQKLNEQDIVISKLKLKQSDLKKSIR